MGTETVNQVLATLREKAMQVEPFSAEGATAYRDAADLLASTAAADASLGARLRIAEAAIEFDWNHEALRRRVAGDASLNAGTAGRPLVTRATMLKLGRGRGSRPRTTKSAPAAANAGKSKSARRRSASSPAEATSAFAKIVAQATRSRTVAP
jgi:hypothetical protein